MPQVDAHLLVGLDVNASRVRAAAGSAGAPQLQPLDGKEPELPAAISLEGRTLEVGRAGAGLCRRLPHLACLDFLHHLDRPRAWAVGRHRLDASRAVSLLLERVQPLCRHAHGLALAVPAYLDLGQVALLTELAGKAKLPVLGSLAAPPAAAP